MIKTGTRFKLTAALLCLVLLCNLTGSVPARASDANPNPAVRELQNQANQISNRLDELEKEQSRIKGEIAAANTKEEEEQATKNYLDSQIAITQEEILRFEELIANLSQEIEIKNGEIDVKQAEHDENYALFLERLRAMYMFGDASTLGLLFGTESFVDFLSKSDTITRIAEHDRNLMQRLTAERTELEAQRTDLEGRREYQESLRVQQKEKQDTLAVQSQAAAVRIQDINTLQASIEADLAAAEAAAAAMEAELQRVYEEIAWSTNPYIGGAMRWPVDNFPKISSQYGWRFGGSDYHTGIDIYGTGIYGQPVRAANAGTIVTANWSHSPGRGYGIYVMIDHGGKISTLYGHMSNITVNVGDVVQRGDPIGAVGSTGWSTGPHLHFEIRENGQHTNPLPYLQG
jgi:murein DD-endopeptidase MepM/ murein hydrolase activator NlpD